MEARKEKIIELRNAIFEASEQLTLDEVLQATMMAQTRMLAETLQGDLQKSLAILTQYRELQTYALPIYCAEAKHSKH